VHPIAFRLPVPFRVQRPSGYGSISIQHCHSNSVCWIFQNYSSCPALLGDARIHFSHAFHMPLFSWGRMRFRTHFISPHATAHVPLLFRRHFEKTRSSTLDIERRRQAVGHAYALHRWHFVNPGMLFLGFRGLLFSAARHVVVFLAPRCKTQHSLSLTWIEREQAYPHTGMIHRWGYEKLFDLTTLTIRAFAT